MSTEPTVHVGVGDYGRRVVLTIDGTVILLPPKAALRLAGDLEDAADAILDHAEVLQ